MNENTESTHILCRSSSAVLRRLARLSLLATALLTVTVPAAARADGDPASDILVSRPAFVPADASATPAEQQRLDAVVAAAAGRGYPIHVALVASAADLGSVTALWRQPQSYAHFLWAELSYVTHAPVLVVMPQGLGLYSGRDPSPAAQGELERIGQAAAGGGLARVATVAVVKIAAAAGHPLPATIAEPPRRGSISSREPDPVPRIVFALGVVVIAAAWGASVRAEPLRRGIISRS